MTELRTLISVYLKCSHWCPVILLSLLCWENAASAEGEAGAECPGPMLAAGPGDSWLISPNKFRGEARVVARQLQAVPAVRQGTGGGDIQHVDLCCYVSRILDLDLQGL